MLKNEDTLEEVLSIKDKLNLFKGNTPFAQLCLSLFFQI